jgi:hypothetical protein
MLTTYYTHMLTTYYTHMLTTYYTQYLYFQKERKKEKKSIRHRYRGNEQLTIEDVCEKTPF